MIQAFTQQLAAVTQQLSSMQNTANAVIPSPMATPPTAPPATRRNINNNRNQRGGRGRTRNSYVQPVAAPTPAAANSNGIPPPAVARTPSTLNYNKYYNNTNYCFSCGYDVPQWHTSETCPYPKDNHQRGCTRANVRAYEQAGHDVCKRGIHKTVMPINPGAHQA